MGSNFSDGSRLRWPFGNWTSDCEQQAELRRDEEKMLAVVVEEK